MKDDVLLVFSVTPFKIGQNKNQNRSIDKVQNLGKERISPRFGSQHFFLNQDIWRSFYPNLYRVVWTRHASAHLDGHKHDCWKLTETSVTEFCYKSVNLSLEELINIKITLFLRHELFR